MFGWCSNGNTMGTLNLRCWRASGTRWNHESQVFESIGNVLGTRNLSCWRALGTWGNRNGNALGYVILLAGFPLKTVRACLPLRVSSCEEEEKIDRAEPGRRRRSFPTWETGIPEDYISPGLNSDFPGLWDHRFRPYSYPAHQASWMPFVISFVKVLELLPIESTSAQTLEFWQFFCVGSDFKPHTKRKKWVSKALGFPKTSFLFLRFGSAVRERERECGGRCCGVVGR